MKTFKITSLNMSGYVFTKYVNAISKERAILKFENENKDTVKYIEEL